MKELLDLLKRSEKYQSIRSELLVCPCQLNVRGVKGTSLSYLIGTLSSDFDDSVIVVVMDSDEDIETIRSDILAFSSVDRVTSFPPWHASLHNGAPPTKEVTTERISTLEMLAHQQKGIVVTSISAILQKTIPIDIFRSVSVSIKKGEEVCMNDILQRLTNAGYKQVNLVESKGQFAKRGGIIDIYPPSNEMPIRIEFYGDMVYSIREFDVTTQRSTKVERDQVSIVPESELILTSQTIECWRERTAKLLSEYESTELSDQIAFLTSELERRGRLDEMVIYLPFFYGQPANLWDYLPDNTILIVDGFQWMQMELNRIIDRTDTFFHEQIEDGRLAVPASDIFSKFDDFQSICKNMRTLYVSYSDPDDVSGSELMKTYDLEMEHFDGIRGNFSLFLRGMERWSREGYYVNVVSDNEKQAERMRDMLLEHKVDNVGVTVGHISSGFLSKSLKLVLLSEDEMFARYTRPRKKRDRPSISISSFIDFKIGDFVVHASHGIGKYGGIKKLKVGDSQQDFLMIYYLDGDILYVPVHQLNMVQKYIGGENAQVRLDKLGGTTWEKAKSRVKESVRKLAKELLDLYATREVIKGHAFSPDTPWQYEFEASFPYEETEDQLQAIEEVKRDMEKPKPMDRLVCGDVGYGKTEVALRAAFKAVMDNKQVAMLVPTTVLAQQHYLTFKNRFANYPIKVEMLSRFVSPKEQKRIIEELSQGKVDVVIGTHRLLSKDIKFRDLGLLIVDEEQKFGVAQKEKIKQMKKSVDVLTLSATPIPRTLHMSIMGLRDLSIIDTPPENRLPIETFVMEYDKDVVRNAILREMDRKGQVFFVHNKVETIDSVAEDVRKLVPEARIAVAHGQMSEKQLERIMLDFISYKYDVLVCTTIIESGLDIPNVNTIIIDRADALGLAQLHQLRGRVGRDQYKAYGYLFYPSDRPISEDSQKRLQVIEEFTELGSGFKIALRDLEIRGVGNILGAEQHGHIAAVGYDMYCKLLEEAVKELKGEEIEEEFEPSIAISVSAYIPDDYVPDADQKISIYRKIAQISNEQEKDDLINELEDRYGKIPVLVKRLITIADIKRLAKTIRVSEIVSSSGEIKFSFDRSRTTVNPSKLVKMVKGQSGYRLIPPNHLLVKSKETGQDQLLEKIKKILQQLL